MKGEDWLSRQSQLSQFDLTLFYLVSLPIHILLLTFRLFFYFLFLSDCPKIFYKIYSNLGEFDWSVPVVNQNQTRMQTEVVIFLSDVGCLEKIPSVTKCKVHHWSFQVPRFHPISTYSLAYHGKIIFVFRIRLNDAYKKWLFSVWFCPKMLLEKRTSQFVIDFLGSDFSPPPLRFSYIICYTFSFSFI